MGYAPIVVAQVLLELALVHLIKYAGSRSPQFQLVFLVRFIVMGVLLISFFVILFIFFSWGPCVICDTSWCNVLLVRENCELTPMA